MIMDKYINLPHLPERKVGLAAAGGRYRSLLAAPLGKLGVAVIWLPDAPGADPRLAGHADLSMVHLGGRKVISSCGVQTEEKLAALGFAVTHVPGPGDKYPHDCALNACIVGGKLFHRLDVTEKALLSSFPDGELINISQGYAKCCICVVDAGSIITSDHGIARAAREHGLDVLEITPGWIALDGFDYGFIGGASFKLSKYELAFTGRLDGHPDYERILSFLRGKGIEAVFLTDKPAFDVGSILPLTER